MDPSFKNNLLNPLYFHLSDHFFLKHFKDKRLEKSSSEKLSKELNNPY